MNTCTVQNVERGTGRSTPPNNTFISSIIQQNTLNTRIASKLRRITTMRFKLLLLAIVLLQSNGLLLPFSCSDLVSFPPWRGVNQLFAIGPWGVRLDKLGARLPFTKKTGTDVLYLDWGSSGSSSTPKAVTIPSNALPSRNSNASIVRVVAVSDTHGKHELLNLPEGDILCHCGDILLRYGYVGNYGAGKKGLKKFCRWMQQRQQKDSYQHTVVIGGNHDMLLERQRFGQRRVAVDWKEYGITYLEHNATELLIEKSEQMREVKVWGSPYSLSTGTSNRAFQSLQHPLTEANFLTDDKTLGNKSSVDIVMTHSGVLGDIITEQVAKAAPKLWLCGHLHDGYGQPEFLENGSTVKINCASTDMKYHITNPPVVVDIHL